MSAIVTTPSRRAGRQVFFASSALLFAVLAWATVLWSAGMAGMGEMPMPGGWTLSMIWMRMPGQTWLGTCADFLFRWMVMMAAMMLPSLAPALRRSVEALGPGRWVVLIGVGYLSVWIALGGAVFLLGAVLAALVMNDSQAARAVPIGVGVVVMSAGALQLTRWKAHQLALCRELPCSRQLRFLRELRSGRVAAALKCGLDLGIRCSLCSAGFTAILLAIGVMDLRAMAAATAAITVERIAPAGTRIARATGAAALVAGLALAISAV